MQKKAQEVIGNLCKAITILCLIIFCQTQKLMATVYTCSTIAEIRTAMLNVVPGDEIVIAPGTYYATDLATANIPAGESTKAHFFSNIDGTASQPITIRSQFANNPAILSGNQPANNTVLRIFGDYWIVKDLKLTHAQKGLVFDNANHCQALNCEVYDIGLEGIHVRDGSDYTLIDGCYVHHTGTVTKDYGEGIYIGTDKGNWEDSSPDPYDTKYDPYVSYTTVKNCTIGPYVSAEAFDIKEGTSETVVEYCTIDATGIAGTSFNFADSFIDLKGTRTYVRYNTFNRSNAAELTKGIAAIDRSVALSSYEHAIHDNIFNMDGPNTGNMVEAYSGTSDVYAWNNTRNPSGDDYNSRVITSCCPSWYNPGGTICTAPSNLTTSNIDSSSVTLSWTGTTGTVTYDLRYQETGSGVWIDVNNLSGTSHTENNLSPSTSYSWEVRTNCGTEQSAYVQGNAFTTLAGADTTSGGGNNGGGGNGGGSGDTTNVDAIVVYDDVLASGWNDYSFSGNYNWAYTADVKAGAKSIKATYGSWGGLYVKRSDDIDAADLTAIRFWVKGEGDYLIRLKVNGKQHEFTTTSDWQQMTIDLTEFDDPTSIYNITFQNRSSSSKVVYYDQIEFIGDLGGTSGGGGADTTATDTTVTDTTINDTIVNENAIYSDVLAEGWNNYSYSGTYDFDQTAEVKVGSKAIKATHGGWGGLLMKKSVALDASSLAGIRFWVKGEGAYLIRLEVNDEEYEFTTSSTWQQMTIDLSQFGNPSTIDRVAFQNRSSSSKVVYYDQIEFIEAGSNRIGITPTSTTLNIYPNPSVERALNIKVNGIQAAGIASIKVFNMYGSQVWNEDIQVQRGIFEKHIKLPDMIKSGIYMIEVSGQNWKTLQKWVLR